MPAPTENPFYPFDSDAVHVLFTRSDGKPRDLLRKAHSLINEGATRNWDVITGERAAGVLDSFMDADDDDFVSPSGKSTPGFSNPDWS